MTVSGWCAAAASNQLQPLCDILEIVLCSSGGGGAWCGPHPLTGGQHSPVTSSAAKRLIGEVVQSQRRPLLGPSPG